MSVNTTLHTQRLFHLCISFTPMRCRASSFKNVFLYFQFRHYHSVPYYYVQNLTIYFFIYEINTSIDLEQVL
jgi:hypothetical protein